MMEQRQFICTYHDDIKILAQKIKKLTTREQTKFGKTTTYDCGNDENIDEINKLAIQIIEIDKLAKVAGQHMENRMSLYRNAIEGLGFERTRGKKHKKK
jgi:hypothetical protein